MKTCRSIGPVRTLVNSAESFGEVSGSNFRMRCSVHASKLLEDLVKNVRIQYSREIPSADVLCVPENSLITVFLKYFEMNFKTIDKDWETLF